MSVCGLYSVVDSVRQHEASLGVSVGNFDRFSVHSVETEKTEKEVRKREAAS